MSLTATVARNVRFRRKELGLSQREVERRAGFLKTTVSRIERHVGILTLDALERFSVVLEIEVEWLVAEHWGMVPR